MFDQKYLVLFEKKLIEDNSTLLNKKFIKSHYKTILQMANPIIFDKKIILNEYQYKLMKHLFNLCNHIEYVPSFFVKQIAEMSSFLSQSFDIDGLFPDLRSSKQTEFLSLYYKIVSVIMKNKYIKQEKKIIFEKILSQKLTENTVQWLIQLFTQPNINTDSKTKVLLKAITQTKFEFFETFAVNFQTTIYDMITNSKSREKSWLNKYVFKIIEKCLIKLTTIEKEFLVNLSKICHNLIEIFIKNRHFKIKKLFRRSMRIMYIIYDRRGEKNSKIIRLFKYRFFPLFSFPETDECALTDKFRFKVLWDLVEVNFTILKRKVDLLDFYELFYSFLINEDEKGEKYLTDDVHAVYSEQFLACVEKMFKYEMAMMKNQIYEIAYIKLLHKLFNMFYSDNINQHKKQTQIEIICRIVRNCANNMKISILEEISFTHISFFIQDTNCALLKNLLDSIIPNISANGIYEYFIKYLDVLFLHAIKGNFPMLEFLSIIQSLEKNVKLFFLALNYCKKYCLQLQEDGLILNKTLPSEVKKILISFLKIIAISSINLPIRYDNNAANNNLLQEILNIYSFFLVVKIFHYNDIDFGVKFKLKPDDDDSDFAIYFLIFADNLPVLIFNRNTFLTSPVKIEINYSILSKAAEQKKIISDEFDDFGDRTKKWIRDLDVISQIYLLGIYISFVAKYFILNVYFDTSAAWQQQKEIVISKISDECLMSEKVSIINLLDYLTDNSFLYDRDMNELFNRIFEKFVNKYLFLIKSHHNTLFKQRLLSYDLMNLLNYSCFYHHLVRMKAFELIKTYAKSFPFLLNEYDIFEYYVNILGVLISNSLKPFEFFIKKIKIDGANVLELPSDQKDNQEIYSKLYEIFESCLQKSHIINNNNIAYNIANYMNQYTLLENHTQDHYFHKEDLNYSVNLLQKIYNNIKKVDIPSLLKTSAYLDPKAFEDYLKEHVYKNFDKYLSLSNIDDIYNFTDYAKSTKLQIRNKYMGIIEGKINNLRNNYSNDALYVKYHTLFSTCEMLSQDFDADERINNYCYYKILNDITEKITKIFNENDLQSISRKISPILIELTSFIVFADMDDFKTTFKKEIITDEIINLITCIPIFLANSVSIETGSFCWEWILYVNKKKLSSLLNNIILSVKCLKQCNCLNMEKKVKSEIFDVEDNLLDYQQQTISQFEQTTLPKLMNKIQFSRKAKLISGGETEHFVNIINEKITSKWSHVGQCETAHQTRIDTNDYINSQIILLKFLKECMNEFCKCDIEKLSLIFDLMKLFVDLNIELSLYVQPLYIYLHFLIFSISLELIDIFQSKIDLFKFLFSTEELYEFKILLYLFGFRYFEFDKQRRMITNKVLLSEIEQTLINCLEMLNKDMNKKEYLGHIEKRSKKGQKKSNKYEKVYTFVYSLETKLKEIEGCSMEKDDTGNMFVVYDNFKVLMIYLIESEMNNLRYWNSPSTFHNQNKKYTPSSSKLKEEKVKDIFETVFTFSNKLSIKLVQRFPWIEKKYPSFITTLEKLIYNNKKTFYHQPLALKFLINHVVKNNLPDLENLAIMKDLILWKFPSLNYALKYISLNYSGMYGLHKYCMHMLDNAPKSAIVFYMPQLIQSLRTKTKSQVEKFILHKCKQSSRIAHQFLWSLEVEEIMGPKAQRRFLPKNVIENVYITAKVLRLKILKNLNVMQRKFWVDEDGIFSCIAEISGKFLHTEGTNLSLKMTKEQKTEFVKEELIKLPKRMENHIYLPTNPDTKIIEIIPSSAVSLQSAKKVPFLVSFTGMSYEGPDSDYLVTKMNVSEFISNEIMKFDNEIVNGVGSVCANNSMICDHLIINGNAKNNLSLNTRGCSKSQVMLEEGNNGVHLNSCMSNHDDSLLEDDPFVYDEQENLQGVIIPQLDIKIFSKLNHEENAINPEASLNAANNPPAQVAPLITSKSFNKMSPINNMNNITSISVSSTYNINDLSNCTDEDVEFEYNNEMTKRKKISKANIPQGPNHDIIDNDNDIDATQLTSTSCIFKVGDDLRQDSLALQVIHIFQEIFKENNLKLFTYPYQTISTISPKYKDLGGFIEVVQDCDSRDQIGKTFDTNLYDYFICSFGQENSNEFRNARKNFIESLAAYAIISYILQIKDRHNGNILVDKYGHIIHIDFGFIFDISPAGNMKFEKAAFKLTMEMLKIMEGTDSESYSTFVDMTIRAFLACRDYMDKLLDPVVLMFNSGLDCFRDKSIRNFIDRFKLELNEDEAAIYMRGLIREAEDNWRTNIYDWIQKKQNNIYY